MPRIYVKNLPNKCTEEQLVTHFKKINSTITDVKLYPERHIAFIGFFDGDITDIKRRFNGTYLGTSKISVYAALSHEQSEQEGRKRGVWKQQEKKLTGQQKQINELYSSGGQILQRYLDYSTQKKWQNDLIINQAKQQEDLPQFQSTEAQDKNQSGKPASKQAEKDPFKIKVSNLPNTADENRLLEIFNKNGELQSITVGQNPLTGEPLGFAYIIFKNTSTVKRLIKTPEMLIDGKYCKIEQANVDSKDTDDKRSKFIPRALDAQNRSSWNAYIHNNRTLQNLITQKLVNQIKNFKGSVQLKRDQVDQVIQKDAVAVAAGEALINIELRDARQAVGLKDEGARSRHTLLVKNIPPDVSESDIETIFQSHGVLKFCNMFFPGFALVSFVQPADARKALGKVAFKRVGSSKSPLMLEFAIGEDVDKYINNQKKCKQQDTTHDQENNDNDDKKDNIIILYITNIASTTTREQFEQILIQKFGQQLQSCELTNNGGVKTFGRVHLQTDDIQGAVRIASQIMYNGNKWVASDKPYGRDKKASALSNLQQQNEGIGGSEELDTNKLLIKNVAFQSTMDELNRLFNQFGRVVALRAPKKLNGELRGFCFVEYASTREAAHAMNVLGETHLYGRRLIIEPSYDQDAANQNAQDLI